MGTVFKNRDQMEEEDSIRHRKKMETIFKNKEASVSFLSITADAKCMME